MPAFKRNLFMEQGSTFNLAVTWTDDSGEPVDLTDYRVRAQLRPTPNSDVVLLSLDSDSPADGVVFGDLNEDGLIDITVSSAVTEELDFHVAAYDLRVTSPAGESARILQGQVVLSRAVTRFDDE